MDICPTCDDLASRGRIENERMALWCGLGHRWERDLAPDELIAEVRSLRKELDSLRADVRALRNQPHWEGDED